jgi:hypothetical protein
MSVKAQSEGKALFVAPLFCIELHDDSLEEPQVFPGLFISKSFRSIEKYLSSDFYSHVGELEANGLRSAKGIVYTLGDPKLFAEFNVTPDEFILRTLEVVMVFLHCLWLVKDHSIHPELGFLHFTQDGYVHTHSNFHTTTITNAKGQREVVSVSAAELRRAFEYSKQMTQPSVAANLRLVKDKGSASRSPLLGSQKTASRLQRAYYFLSAARSTIDLGIKTVNYCTALETLFSTDSSELTYKVSHRIAVFLGSGAADKVSRFNLVKKAYGIRSKVVHGEGLGPKEVETVQSLSTELDELARRVFSRIYMSSTLQEIFGKTKEELERYFLESSFAMGDH